MFSFQPFDFNVNTVRLWFKEVPVPASIRPTDAPIDLKAPQMVVWLTEVIEVCGSFKETGLSKVWVLH
jgi:hypothetical protein